jgi:hypothetical protein
LSISSSADFEPWIKSAYREMQGFTALIVLVKIGEDTVTPVASTYVHLIGDDLCWSDFSALLSRSGQSWDGVAIFAESAKSGGPIPDALAKIKLREIELRLGEDRIHINEGHFFDVWGRRMRVEETAKTVQ